MSFNYGEIHMFDNVRKDMESPKPGMAGAPKNFPFAAPVNGRRHTIANLWAPFPDDKGIHVGNNSTSVTNPPPPPPKPILPSIQSQSNNRRLSVIDRMRQYMSPGVDNNGVNTFGRMKHYPPKILPYATPVSHAIAAHILTTVAMVRGCKCPRTAIVAK